MSKAYIIYQIRALDPNIEHMYVGSTQDFTKRKCRHKTNCYNPNDRSYKIPLYQFIRANGGWDAFEMVPLKEVQCDTKLKARMAEEDERKKLKEQLNVRRAHRDEDAKNENRQTYNHQYYEQNREQLLVYQQLYREQNSERLLGQKHQYYLDNKDKIMEKHKTKIMCDCGALVSSNHFARHKQSANHQNIKTNSL
jgi:hypothetical protein